MSEVYESTTEVPPLQKDFLLVALVEVADSLSLGLTLNVGGTLVSGLLISNKDYFESIADEFESVNEDGAKLASLYRRFAATHYSDTSGDAITEYIHLKDVVIAQGETSYLIKLWRGKLNSVDGFSFGTLKK
ncbi:gas vesicle accessory protein GvpU [Paenibacillus sp. 4624]|uniref:gas vesicle accessory protein GvpU n=1 Tax=Paenibacillus sp. 4624 TaxID=3156453 RepID=UPI003D1C1623